MNKLTIRDVALGGTRVLTRVDFNVPLDDALEITDDTRLVASLPTINALLAHGASVILMSHLGRPKGAPNPRYSLRPVALRLSALLGRSVMFAPDCVGADVEAMAAALRPGDVLLLENLRFHPEEEANDETFARGLAALGDVFVNDAFGTAHRAHASTEGVARFLRPALAGLLMEKEIDYLGRAVGNPERPYLAILGGAKISGKIDVIANLLTKVDTLLIGGGMMFTFLKAQGMEIGTSLLEEDKLDLARELLAQAKTTGKRLLLPVDTVVGQAFSNDTETRIVPVTEIPAGMMGLDIGPETIAHFSAVIAEARTIVWNGPMGVFEMPAFARGTFAIAEALAAATRAGAVTVIGGGDSAAAVAQAGLDHSVSHVSTGGGASLELLEGRILPGVAALTDRSSGTEQA
ncbi:MAG: phosphoglycerate kinase [Bacteroidota bacterium]|jgi:phosphoglycerate kinase|nr:phosphoglycerate kinase [Bacteroidota bacterium]